MPSFVPSGPPCRTRPMLTLELEPTFASIGVVVVAKESRSKAETERAGVNILDRVRRIRVMKEGSSIKGENDE